MILFISGFAIQNLIQRVERGHEEEVADALEKVNDKMTENTSNEENSQDNVSGATEEKTIDGKNYVVVLHVAQTHYTLDITEHIKDSINTVDIPMPTTKEFYDSVNIGDIINDDFRAGSFVMKGSFGKWKITVKDKYLQ